jgi:ferritin-like metal-binding protein YciE
MAKDKDKKRRKAKDDEIETPYLATETQSPRDTEEVEVERMFDETAAANEANGQSEKLDSLRALLVHELQDLYSAEQQLVEALPTMADAARDGDLSAALREHLKQTKNHVKRLEHIFDRLETEPGAHTCLGMKGLIREAQTMMRIDAEPEVRDAALISQAQRVEHYEMAAYGTARTYAELLGDHESADLLDETLQEEGAADVKLDRLAERRINAEAISPPGAL